MNAPVIKRSYESAYIKVSLSIHDYTLSLFKFLNNYNMLKDKYKDIKSYEHCCFLMLYIPVKMLSKLPFVLAALNSKQINNCLYGKPSLKLVRNRTKNYYCEDFFKKLVSIFGNEKACNEFNVTNIWKPKLSFIRRDYDCCPYLLSSYFNFAQYKLVNYCTRYTLFSDFGVIACWSDEKAPCMKQYNPVVVLNTISKRRISRTLNNPSEEAIKDFRESIHILETNRKFLTKDGLELQKDLNSVRALVL